MSGYREACYCFTTSLHEKLKEKINGSIHVSIEEDILKVIIKKDDFKFNYELNDMSSRLLYGGDMDRTVYDIVYTYKKAVLKKYFR